MFDQHLIREAAHRLLRAAPGSKVILFGSYARGDAKENSDLDFLVIEPSPQSSIEEYVRLRLALRPLPIWIDLVITTQDEFEQYKNIPATIFHAAHQEGIFFNEAA